jgi:hypothetical protein
VMKMERRTVSCRCNPLIDNRSIFDRGVFRAEKQRLRLLRLARKFFLAQPSATKCN